MNKEKLICDKRGGCIAIYKESKKNDTNGCHFEDERNIAYSSKNAKYNGNSWDMDNEIQNIFEDMVNAYNEKYFLTPMATEQELPDCTIESNIVFTVETKSLRVFHNLNEIWVEFDNAKIYEPDEKHVIKTFSDATLIEEISRRYNVDIIINNEKDNR